MNFSQKPDTQEYSKYSRRQDFLIANKHPLNLRTKNKHVSISVVESPKSLTKTDM